MKRSGHRIWEIRRCAIERTNTRGSFRLPSGSGSELILLLHPRFYLNLDPRSRIMFLSVDSKCALDARFAPGRNMFGRNINKDMSPPRPSAFAKACPCEGARLCAQVISSSHRSQKIACPTRGKYNSVHPGNRRTGAEMEWSLGSFGDLRLDKGGPRSSNGWSHAKRCACAALAVSVVANCALDGSSPTPR